MGLCKDSSKHMLNLLRYNWAGSAAGWGRQDDAGVVKVWT